jgi:uncharacterized protein YecE (DUF72 family)
MRTASSELRIGTSGWNYPTGRGTWNGVFYPKPRPRGFDELVYYAEHFNTVEVNSTFYGQPRAEVSRGWAERTPDGFEFSVKLFQKFTHPRMYAERIVKGLPEDARAPADAVQSLVDVNAADLDEFRRGIDPLASAGKLGALLAQFPPSFKDSPATRAYVERLLRAFGDYAIAVELRHKSWSDRIGETLAMLNAFRAAWVQIDEPKFQLSIRQNYLPNVEGFYYMRLHGRNAAKWWKHDKSEDRYDYLYTASELKEFAETADAAKRLVKKLYLYTNNHFSAKSVANANMIKEQLGEPIEGEYPPAFVEQFSQLRSALESRTRHTVGTPVGTRSAPTLRDTD